MSFLNVGKRVASSKENLLIFGGNVKEDGIMVKRYYTELLLQLQYLESKVFLSGELTNADYYFVAYANVNQDNCRDVNKVFSLEDDDADWKPFSFKKRIEDSISVEKKKVELLKKSKCGKVNRTTITTYIGKTLHSRQ